MRLNTTNSLIISFCLLFTLTTKAQTCAVVFESSDTNFYFTSKLNQQIQNSVFVNNIKLTGLTPNNKYLAELQFKNDTIELRETLFLLDAGFTHFYKVDKKGIRLKKIAPTLDEKPDPNQYLVVYDGWQKPQKPVKSLIDSNEIEKDTIEFESHYQLKDYEGKIGCQWPLNDDNFNALLIELKQKKLEDDKLAYLKEQLDTACILTEQLSKVFTTLEYEESKLDFGLFIYTKTFDVDRFFDIAKQHLKFESHIEEIREKYKVKND